MTPSARALRAAFWSALPAALPPGARVQPPTDGTTGLVVLDGEHVDVNARYRAGRFNVDVGSFDLRHLGVEEAPARVAAAVMTLVAGRRRGGAS